MDIYLIRHADALPLGAGGITRDEDRPLSDHGVTQAKALAPALQRRGVTLGLVLTSPLLRARQTAEGMLRAWSAPVPELEVCECLAAGARPKELARFLRNWSGERVALVGHQPDLGRFAAWLVGSKKGRIDLAKAGVAYITCDGEPRRRSGTLVWLVTREWL